MSSRHKLLFLLSFVIVGIISYGLLNIESDTSLLLPPSTFSARPNGYKALFLLLDELNLPVARLRSRYTRLESTNGVLVVLDPHVVPFSMREVKSLKKWIRNGNTLILFHGGPKIRIPPAPIWGQQADSKKKPRDNSKQKKQKEAKGSSLAHKLDLVLTRTGKAIRSTVDVSWPKLYEVKKLSVSERTRWKGTGDKWTTVVGDKGGPIIVSLKMGKGEVIAVSDASIASNQALSLDQNVRLIPALLLQNGKPDRVLFDEYHHGYALAKSFWHYVSSSIFGWILLQVLVAGAFLLYSRRASHAGRFRSLTQPTGRSSLEYVHSMANVFESSKAGTVALDAILQRFLSQLSRRAGIPLWNLERDADEQIGSLFGEPDGSGNVIRECREAVRSGTETSRTFALARRLSELRVLLNRGVR